MTKSMLEKLTEHYKWTQELGVEGHAVGYYCEKFELIKSSYEFPNGKFFLRSKHEIYFSWNYKSNK